MEIIIYGILGLIIAALGYVIGWWACVEAREKYDKEVAEKDVKNET